jgi:hypothetical protein
VNYGLENTLTILLWVVVDQAQLYSFVLMIDGNQVLILLLIISLIEIVMIVVETDII